MLRFFPNAKRSLDSLLILITDLVTDGLLFFRLLFRSRTALSAEVLFLRKQLAFHQERQVQPRRLNDSARFPNPGLAYAIGKKPWSLSNPRP